MRNILSLIFLLIFSSPVFGQISLTGTKTATTTKTNKQEVTFVRKGVAITKVIEEQIVPGVVVSNQIGSSNVKKENNSVKVNLTPSANSGGSNQIILDLKEAKQEDPPKVVVQTPDPTTEVTVVNKSTTEPVVKVPEDPIMIDAKPVGTPVVTPPTEIKPYMNTEEKVVVAPVKTSKTIETNVPNPSVVTPSVVNNNLASAPVEEIPSAEDDESSAYPQKNANNWAIGLNFGIPFVKGDVRSKAGYGASFTIQKALGHVVSLRYQSFFGQTFGQDWKLQTNESQYKNYKTRISDHSIQAVFSLNNINFYKREPKVIFNVITGVGFSTRFSWTNILDANGNVYDYSGVPAAVDRGDRKEILEAINDIHDDGFETKAVADKLGAHIKDTEINPAVILGMGLGFKLSKRVDLNLEHRISWHNSDTYDAYQANGDNDWLHYTSLGLNIKLGKKEESMWWMNPVYSTYDDINDLKQKVDEGNLLTDLDQDGVADIFDKDLNTPPNVLVNSKGVASDLDQDGVPDYMDKEPFTPVGAAVDKNGIAIDSDGDGVADLYDMEANTVPGNAVDAKGRAITIPVGNLNNGKELGMILFKNNSIVIQREYYSVLYDVLSLMNSNPSARIVITGHADVKASEAYNLELSKERAVAVYQMLTEVFKLPSSRIEYNYVGEKNPLIPGLPENSNSKYEPGHQMNRRVTVTQK